MATRARARYYQYESTEVFHTSVLIEMGRPDGKTQRGRIGGGKARSILVAALARETDRFAIAEMKAALEVA